MKKSIKVLYLGMAIFTITFVTVGCNGNNAGINENQEVDYYAMQEQEDSKQWLSQTTEPTDLEKYPCEYLVDFDSIVLDMTEEEVLNTLVANGMEYSVIEIDENNSYVSYNLSFEHNGLNAEMLLSFRKAYEGNQFCGTSYTYVSLSREQALAIFSELESYYNNLSTSSRTFDDDQQSKRIGYQGGDFDVYITVGDSFEGDSYVRVRYDGV